MLIPFLSSCPLPCLLMLHTEMDELADDKRRHDRSMNVAGWLETSDIFLYEFHLKRCLIRMKKNVFLPPVVGASGYPGCDNPT